MKITELKQRVESWRTGVESRADLKAPFSENREAETSIVDAIFQSMESLEARLAEVEERLGDVHHGTFPRGLESQVMHDRADALQLVKEAAADDVRATLKERLSEHINPR